MNEKKRERKRNHSPIQPPSEKLSIKWVCQTKWFHFVIHVSSSTAPTHLVYSGAFRLRRTRWIQSASTSESAFPPLRLFFCRHFGSMRSKHPGGRVAVLRWDDASPYVKRTEVMEATERRSPTAPREVVLNKGSLQRLKDGSWCHRSITLKNIRGYSESYGSFWCL